MSDWYENDGTRPRVCLNATAPALVVPAPQFVIPEKAGIQRGGDGECSAVEDYARRGACPPLGSGVGMAKPPCQFGVPSHNSSFSYLGVPAPAGMSDCMKACPGPRSGIDRSGSLSFAIRGIPSSIRRPISSFRRRPESRGVGRGDSSVGACPQLRMDRSFAQVVPPGVP